MSNPENKIRNNADASNLILSALKHDAAAAVCRHDVLCYMATAEVSMETMFAAHAKATDWPIWKDVGEKSNVETLTTTKEKLVGEYIGRTHAAKTLKHKGAMAWEAFMQFLRDNGVATNSTGDETFIDSDGKGGYQRTASEVKKGADSKRNDKPQRKATATAKDKKGAKAAKCDDINAGRAYFAAFFLNRYKKGTKIEDICALENMAAFEEYMTAETTAKTNAKKGNR
jgi:hypothetical protein